MAGYEMKYTRSQMGVRVFQLSLLCLGVAVFLQWPGKVSSIILCDGDCINQTDLEICVKPGPDRTPLLVMGLFPCEVPEFRARGLTVAAQMAIKELQKSTTVLPNYRLNLDVSNTMCSGLAGVRAFIDQLLQDETRYMIIGPGCSTGAVRIAELSPVYNLTQISYTATSITLSDKRRFPNFLRTIPSDNASITAFSAIIREYGWQQVAVVTQINELFSNLSAVLRRELEGQGVTVLTERLAFTGGLDDTSDVVQQLNNSGARIVILNVFENFAREIFCVAYRRGMTSPRYVYLSFYWYTEFWWKDNITRGSGYTYDPVLCDPEEVAAALDRSLAPDYFPVAPPEKSDAATDVGYTPNGFWSEFRRNLDELDYRPSDAIRQARYAYDAVWAAALALHNASEELGAAESLLDYDYNRSDINNLILKAARDLTFRGVSGKVKFNQFGDREPTIQFFQYRFNTPEDLTVLPPSYARIDSDTGRFMYEEGEGDRTVFPGGVPVVAEEVLIDPILFGFYTALSYLGIIFAIICLCFNLIFRKRQIVKLSSPYLNVLIIVGAIFFYVDVILFGVDENTASYDTVDILCQARVWITSIGFSLFFGTMLAKTWRVYYIFRSVELKKKPLKDWVLFLIVAGLVGVDIVFLVIVSFWRLELEKELVAREGGEIPQIFTTCDSDAAQYWLPVLLAYKGLFLIVGIFLAAQTYNVKIKELRDSKLIVASVFGIAVISVVIAVVALAVRNEPVVTYSVIGLFIMLLVTGILILLFVTRMMELWKNPSGEVQLSSLPSNHSTDHLDNRFTLGLNSDDSAKIARLRETIQSLKREIETLKSVSLEHDPQSMGSKANLIVAEKEPLPKEDPVLELESGNGTETKEHGMELNQNDIITHPSAGGGMESDPDAMPLKDRAQNRVSTASEKQEIEIF